MPPYDYKISSKPDIHQEITNTIIKHLEQVSLEDYASPFAHLAAQGIPINPTTDKAYQGINILSLWFNQQSRAYPSNHWATYKQWKDSGAQVKKGTKGHRVIFFKPLEITKENQKGEEVRDTIPLLKLYTVFNADQVDGYEDQDKVQLPKDDLVKRLKQADAFCTATKADIRHEANMAFYRPAQDFINMPPTPLFRDSTMLNATQHYYATLLHELTHWTGAEKRLNRPGITQDVTKQDYAFEELIAEIGAAFLCAQHDITQSISKNHAAYIKSWLQALRDDKTLVFKAAAQAAKAVRYLNHIQPLNETDTTEPQDHVEQETHHEPSF